MSFTNPVVSQFQAQFVRDFPYGTDPKNSVLDSDISYAFQMVNVNINQALFPDQGTYTMGYLLMAAHFLCMNLRASEEGQNGQFSFLEASKGAGAVSQSFSIPQRILDNPYFSMLCKTNYGLLFLELIMPQLAGNVFVGYGRTKP